jgi:hypothetical protein
MDRNKEGVVGVVVAVVVMVERELLCLLDI